MKRLALLMCSFAMMLIVLAGCGSQAATVTNGVIQGDGSYTVSATLEGGSGKASIDTPVKIAVSGTTMTATVVMSSSNYDLMVIDGVEYRPSIASGKSTFTIPVASLDAPLAIQAETTAMSTAHLIDYNIVFDSKTAKKA